VKCKSANSERKSSDFPFLKFFLEETIVILFVYEGSGFFSLATLEVREGQ